LDPGPGNAEKDVCMGKVGKLPLPDLATPHSLLVYPQSRHSKRGGNLTRQLLHSGRTAAGSRRQKSENILYIFINHDDVIMFTDIPPSHFFKIRRFSHLFATTAADNFNI
jgi:hypothetical protein